MNNTKRKNITKITIQGNPNSFLRDCMEEQVILSAKEQVIVDLHWRSSKYTVNPENLVEGVKMVL